MQTMTLSGTPARTLAKMLNMNRQICAGALTVGLDDEGHLLVPVPLFREDAAIVQAALAECAVECEVLTTARGFCAVRVKL